MRTIRLVFAVASRAQARKAEYGFDETEDIDGRP
jgi:hypothetical protein